MSCAALWLAVVGLNKVTPILVLHRERLVDWAEGVFRGSVCDTQ